MLADQPCFLTGEMLLAHVLDPLWWPIGGPHANGGKTCFQFALGPQPPTHIFPLGVSKHVFRRHRQQIRNMSLTGAPPTSYRKDQLHPRWIYFLTPQDTDCPNQPARRETLTEWRAETVSGICQHTAEANTGCDHAINLGQRDLWLGSRYAMLDWNTGTLHPRRIARPTLGNKETQCDHHRNFTARKRQRHQRLAIGRLAERRGILRSDTNRTIALLRHRGVVDDQHRILAADKSIGLNKQF